jgi:hypothetical protein
LKHVDVEISAQHRTHSVTRNEPRIEVIRPGCYWQKARDGSRLSIDIARGHLHARRAHQAWRLRAIREQIQLHKMKLHTRHCIGDESHLNARLGGVAGDEEQGQRENEERAGHRC